MLASGVPMIQATRLANKAAGIVVGKLGTATVPAQVSALKHKVDVNSREQIAAVDLERLGQVAAHEPVCARDEAGAIAIRVAELGAQRHESWHLMLGEADLVARSADVRGQWVEMAAPGASAATGVRHRGDIAMSVRSPFPTWARSCAW